MSNEKTLLTLSDASILHIVKLLQVAIISGTDITDHFRQLTFTSDDKQITISELSESILENTIKEMLQKAPEEGH